MHISRKFHLVGKIPLFAATFVRPVEILISRLLTTPFTCVHHVKVLGVARLYVEFDRL